MTSDQIQNFLISEADLLREKASKRLTAKNCNSVETNVSVAVIGSTSFQRMRMLGGMIESFLERLVKEDRHSPHLRVFISFNKITAVG